MKINATRIGADTSGHMLVSTTDTTHGDLDLIAIELAMNGELVPLTDAEKLHAAHLLHNRGLDGSAIARLLGEKRQVVDTWRSNGWAPPRPEGRPRTRSSEPIDIGKSKHGRAGYTKGCGCDICRTASADYARTRRADQRTAAAA